MWREIQSGCPLGAGERSHGFRDRFWGHWGAERVKIGYFLSSEEWGPKDLICQAIKAQEAGFEGLWISDHYHPWNDDQDAFFGAYREHVLPRLR
jgi:hypothetical protein